MQDTKKAFYELRRSGDTSESARKKIGISRMQAVRIENEAKQHFRGKHITRHVEKALRDLLLKDGVSFSEAARRIGCCKRTVIRFAKRIRAAYVKQRGQVNFESRSAICPVHGKISVVPCVACAAKASTPQAI